MSFRSTVVALSLAATASGWAAASPPEAEKPIGVLLAAGDITYCWTDGYKQVGKLIAQEIAAAGETPVRVLVLGDVAYENGNWGITYRECFQAFADTWGKAFGANMLPVLGNHEYSDDAAGGGTFKAYFASLFPAGNSAIAADDENNRENFYYAARFPDDDRGWLLLGLNSEVALASQEQWLDRTLNAASERCVLAFAHKFIFSSGDHGAVADPDIWLDEEIQPLLRQIRAHAGSLFVSAHDHHYERFNPVTADGAYDAEGVRLFIAGTGGGRLYGDPPGAHDQSAAFENDDLGVLKIELYPDGYRWSFLTVDGPILDAAPEKVPCNVRP